MNTVIPIIVPINSEEDHCPKCGKPENIVKTCNHCGYKYVKENTSFVEAIGVATLVVIAVLLFVWVMFIIFEWLDQTPYVSLVDVIKSQIDWLKSIRIW